MTHFDDAGNARMVDIGRKAVSERQAVAVGTITMSPACLSLVRQGGIKKGDVFAVARLAGIMAAKRTPDLIPLAHPLPISGMTVDFGLKEPDTITITATVNVTGKTGVEMEALTAVSLSALTIYDMCKAIDKSMVIGDIKLLRKSGGKSGLFERDHKSQP